jgi:hypothetical protein
MRGELLRKLRCEVHPKAHPPQAETARGEVASRAELRDRSCSAPPTLPTEWVSSSSRAATAAGCCWERKPAGGDDGVQAGYTGFQLRGLRGVGRSNWHPLEVTTTSYNLMSTRIVLWTPPDWAGSRLRGWGPSGEGDSPLAGLNALEGKAVSIAPVA